MNTLRNEQGDIEYFLGLLTNMTEIKRSHKQLEHLATHDVLTGLPNRTVLDDRLEQGISRAIRIKQLGALLFLDLDHFKEINDS